MYNGMMDVNTIKEFISSNTRWFSKLRKDSTDTHNHNIRLAIEELTSFLDTDASLIQRGWHIMNDVYHTILCKECNVTPVNFKKNKSRYADFCSSHCSNKNTDKITKTKHSNVKKYGVDNPLKSSEIQDKIRNTNLERYGVTNVLKSDTILDKVKKTNLERYGVDNPLKSSEIQDKIRNTNLERYGTEKIWEVDSIAKKRQDTVLERYGTEYIGASKEITDKIKATNLGRYNVESTLSHDVTQNKIRESMLKRYGVEYTSQSIELRAKMEDTMLATYGVSNISQLLLSDAAKTLLSDSLTLIKLHHDDKLTLYEIADSINVHPTTVANAMRMNNIEIKRFYQSVAEKEIKEFLQNNNILVEDRVRNIIKGELDFYLPEYKIAIEYNGIYYHSEAVGKNKKYHKNKYEECKRHNIRLLSILETEWNQSKDIVKNKILHILGINTGNNKIYARKTKIITVPKDDKAIFFDKNHIQGDGPSSINYGLEYNGELVACIGFIKQQDCYVLNRYATSMNVVGGFTKLLYYFQLHHTDKQIITFADLRWSEGDLYYNSGFILDAVIPPDYVWCKGNRIWHKFNFRHTTGLKKLNNYDSTLSEVENMHNHGFYRMWDIGKLRFMKPPLTVTSSSVKLA